MKLNTYEIRDNCRRNLAKYTLKAFSCIPKIDNPAILDVGCGTGEPVLALLEICNGKIYAVDSDKACVSILNEKVNALNYSNRIKVIHASLFDTNLFREKFDIILAEGLLNVIGFENGLPILIKHLKQMGYLIIHDELHNDAEKKNLFQKYNLKLLSSFILDEDVWWNDYYFCLEKSIKNKDDELLFEKEINEIIEFKKNPKSCRSIYYILKKLD